MKKKYEKPELLTEVIALEIVKAQECCAQTDPCAYNDYKFPGINFNNFPPPDDKCDCTMSPRAY